MKSSSNKNLAYGGMLAALVLVATSFLKLPVAVTQGYIHLGDGVILLGAGLLGPSAIAAAAVGSMLADLLGGYVTYCLPTFVIKAAAAAVGVWAAGRKQSWLRIAGFALAECVMVAGYFVAEWLFMGYGWAAAVSALLPNAVQGIGGVILATVLWPVVKRLQAVHN